MKTIFTLLLILCSSLVYPLEDWNYEKIYMNNVLDEINVDLRYVSSDSVINVFKNNKVNSLGLMFDSIAQLERVKYTLGKINKLMLHSYNPNIKLSSIIKLGIDTNIEHLDLFNVDYDINASSLKFRNLKLLIMFKCNIKVIDKDLVEFLNKNKKLWYLHLQNNNIVKLPDNLFVDNLQSIDLRFNLFREIPSQLISNNLNDLYLSNNLIRNIDISKIKFKCPSNLNVDLIGNPLTVEDKLKLNNYKIKCFTNFSY